MEKSCRKPYGLVESYVGVAQATVSVSSAVRYVKLDAHCEDFEQPAVGNWLELKIEHVQYSVVARN